MKTLKFAEHLVPLVVSGEKTSTWRLFDDKDLRVGDELALINKDSGEEFAKAVITTVAEKQLCDISDADCPGHERYESAEHMLETLRGYYGNQVQMETTVKLIDFELRDGGVAHWKRVDEKLVKDGWRKVISRTYILPNGKQYEYEIKKEGVAVCILPITKEGKVVLAKQFRVGPEKVLLELPGGGLEKGETPEQAIARELLEETGYAGNVQLVQTILDDAYSTRIRYAFVATDCVKVGEPQMDETEFIEAVELTVDEFRTHLRAGQLTDLETGYLGLDFLKLL
jgi:ADP-ribose pyrophosphatase